MLEPGEARRAALARNAENRARLAFVSETYRVTVYQGEDSFPTTSRLPSTMNYDDGELLYPDVTLQRFPDAAEFGLAFVERPFVTTGVVLDVEDFLRSTQVERDEYHDEDPPVVPVVTGMVTEWDLNEHGFYIGAWCAASCFYPYAGFQSSLSFQIDFTFHGTAMKDVDPEVRD